MSTKDTHEGPGARWRDDVLEVVGEHLDEVPAITRRTMFGVPAFFLEGRLLCCVWGDGVGLRLPLEQAQTVVGADGLDPFKPFGRAPMSGWVQRNGGAEGLKADRALILSACEYVRGL
jgi:hypothetical protein